MVNDFVVLRSGVTTGVTDASGKVATFTFSTSTSGNVNFALANVQLVDSEAGSLVHTTSGTSVVIGSCGDNVIQAGLGETCDDGNTDDGDGCSSVCMDISCSDS
ncbi:MAG: DUF4215 domain-containing protein, partial [Nanoarchaeota archaeon]|nr:DUF4215 domain-containing protein [Nanoarchaeota archaeon]